MRAGLARLVLGALIVAVLAACQAATGSPDASGTCTTDSRAAGLHPALEALLPTALGGVAPTTVDSGTNCTSRALGSYPSHGVDRLVFAGATWDAGGGDATVTAILATEPPAPALQAQWVEEFYTAGAVAGSHIGEVATTRPTMAGAGEVFRLEVINDLSLQTVVVWPAGPYVRVVIVATSVDPGASRADHDRRVEAAVQAAAAVAVE